MSRGFFGGGGSGDSKRPGAAKGDLMSKKSLMSTLNFSRNRKKTQAQLIRERTTHKMPDYKEMVEDLLDEKMFNLGANPHAFHLPGTVPPAEKEMSKGRAAAIEHVKMKRMKQRMKMRDQKVDVVPKHYAGRAGGWIDKKGKIRNKHGVIVMEVNLNTGVISNRMGMKVGKYNPNSYSNDFKIQRLIDKYTADQKVFNPFGGDPRNHKFNPFGGND